MKTLSQKFLETCLQFKQTQNDEATCDILIYSMGENVDRYEDGDVEMIAEKLNKWADQWRDY